MAILNLEINRLGNREKQGFRNEALIGGGADIINLSTVKISDSFMVCFMSPA